MGFSSSFSRLCANFVKPQSTSAQALLSLDSMNFHKSATALVLVAMALTSCKSPSSDSSESAPQAEETISMVTACEEIQPLLTELGPIITRIEENAKTDVSNDDDLSHSNAILDKIDGIGDSVETEEGRGAIWDLTKAVDEFYKALSSGENIDASTDAAKEAVKALQEQCLK